MPLQVAAAVVSPGLEIVATYEAKINATAAQLASMVPFVRDMHTPTGLLAALEAGEGKDLEVVDREFADFVGEHIELLGSGASKGKWGLAGNSVSGVDSPVMTGFFPVAGSMRSHRVIDVSSGYRMFLRYAPQVAAAFPNSGRRPRHLQRHPRLPNRGPPADTRRLPAVRRLRPHPVMSPNPGHHGRRMVDTVR